jgi:hypothetical protein
LPVRCSAADRPTRLRRRSRTKARRSITVEVSINVASRHRMAMAHPGHHGCDWRWIGCRRQWCLWRRRHVGQRWWRERRKPRGSGVPPRGVGTAR